MPSKSKFLDKPLVHLLLIVFLGFLVYANTFDAPFTFDDRDNIINNPLIKDVSNIPFLFSGGGGQWASRPLLHASAALNYHFGGLDTTGYHAVNIALHLINGVLLYLLVAMTGRHLGYDEKTVRATAVISSALFVLHPIQTEAVTNVVNRSVLFATTFYFSGIILFLKSVTSDKRQALYIGGLFVVSLLGMGSRENFATFPLMLLIYDLLFISKFRLREATRHYRAYLPVILSAAYLGYLAGYNTYTKSAGFPGQGIPPLEYALTQFKVHWTYLRLMALPANQNLDYDYPAARTLFELPTLVSLLGYAALWGFGIVLARRRPVAAFSVLWFLVTLIPIAFMVTFMGLMLDDVIFEHRAYLPSAGIFTAVATGTILSVKSLNKNGLRIAAILTLCVVHAALASATYARNGVWQSEMGLWEDVVKKSPGKARPHNNLGILYMTRDERGKAIEHYETAIKLDPSYANTYINLGNIYLDEGLHHKAIKYYEAAQFLMPSHPDARYNLGVAYQSMGMADEAIEYYRSALEADPNYALAHFGLGNIYFQKGLVNKARQEYEAGLKLEPGNIQAQRNLDYIKNLE
jgi:tetratricopeptide (TPR) repeat protein